MRAESSQFGNGAIWNPRPVIIICGSAEAVEDAKMKAGNNASAKGFTLVGTTQFWNVWSTAAFYAQHAADFDAPRMSWLDASCRQIAEDLGFQLTPQRGRAYDGEHLDVVLDPTAQGGAHTGTAFGSHGVSVSPDALYNSGYGITGFWWSILTMHEAVNVMTGSIAQGWVWADGSPMWAGQSPFPNMCDIVVARETGRGDVSSAQLQRMIADPGVSLFLWIQQTYGWAPFQRLFRWTKLHGITDWHRFREPSLRTATLVWFLACATPELGQSSLLLDRFNSALQRISGMQISASDYSQAQALFPDPSQ
jgi:hypothetical protein